MVIKPVGYLLVVARRDVEVLPLYSIESYTDSKPVEYNYIAVLGRKSPLVVWTSGGARKVNLTVKFFAQKSAKEEVLDKIKRLKQLTEPSGAQGVVYPPPRVKVKFYAYEIEGVIENLSVGGGDVPIVADELIPHIETVQIDIVEVVDDAVQRK